MNEINTQLENECANYDNVIQSIENFLEDNDFDKDYYLIDSIAQDCYESDGTCYTLIASEDEILDSINENTII